MRDQPPERRPLSQVDWSIRHEIPHYDYFAITAQ